MMAQVFVPSKYQPIWDQLKAEGKVSIVVPLPLHRRVIKAVIKRKDEDLGFKLQNLELCRKAKLHYKVEASVIKFTLSYHLSKHITTGAL